MSQAHVYEIEVAASAIDINGHPNNVESLRRIQDAASSHSDAAGCTDATRAHGATRVVGSHRVEYLRPCFAGDRVEVRTRVADFRRDVSSRERELVRRGDGSVLARGETNRAFVNAASGRSRSVPGQIQARFTAQVPGP